MTKLSFLLLLTSVSLGLQPSGGTDVVKVSEFSCGGASPQSRQLVVELANPKYESWLSTKNQRERLEDLVVDNYNDLSFQSCDIPYFRTLSSASLVDLSDNSP